MNSAPSASRTTGEGGATVLPRPFPQSPRTPTRLPPMTGVSRSSAGQYLVLAAKPNGGRTIGLRRAQSYKALSDQLRRDRLVALKTWTLPQWAGRDDKVSLKDQSELHLQLSQLLVRG